MIAKKREVPLTILKLEALLRRLPLQHPKRVLAERDLAKRNAGFKGEESVDIRFNSLPEKEYFIFHDLCLNNGTYNFQMDSLIISRNFALITEVKNIAGTLYFDRTFNQLIRILNDKEEGFPDPILQMKRQQRELVSWLEDEKFTTLPTEYLVIISNPSTLIKLKSGYSREYEKIIHSADLENKIKELENKYSKEAISQKEFKKLSRILLREHSPHDPNILDIYSIPREDILTGVICPTCSHFPIIRKKGFWLCPSCNTASEDAHIQGVRDYFLLIKPSLTSAELRKFLHVDSRHTATRILKSMELSSEGAPKNRTYFQPPH
ncbi:nuclease-related domain-containing protein [Bacillus sp. CECT 9360]|uniref:nuclease-related domain-containing protein n=1 Tax=Bacillus sp. CECT 9360 TaxID=2845821 RepID=UPI001E49B99E|nr:nuclease-related domain-containing protein [Bacillus sp. CECT 9360]CAH0347314.1 hypothetical protein BCI9360_03707 [Bacillus sp. CECT 9360]